MTKGKLIDLANAKEARIVHLYRKNKERKAALKVVQAALATAQATQVAAAQPAVTTLIPKPRGTCGRGGFNLANEMGINAKTSHQIQGFVRSLVNMSALDKAVSWKNQPGDEVHKIFTVTADKYPIMKDFEYNWATAEMVKMYLKNSRAQEAQKRRKAAEVSAGTEEAPAINPGLTTVNNGVGTSTSDVDSESSDEDE